MPEAGCELRGDNARIRLMTMRDVSALPAISVVTPSLNQGRFLADALESVAHQKYPLVEHIIVEGGSTDESPTVLDSYCHYRHLRVIEVIPPQGQSHAVNVGFRAASGGIIGWLNADDRYCENAFRTVVAALDREGFDLVYGDWQAINEAGEVIGTHKVQPLDLTEMLNGVNNTIAQPTVFFRRSLLDRIGYLDETLHYVMDYDFWLRAARVASMGYIEKTVAQFRLHPDSKTVRQTHLFFREARRVARAHGGPFLSTALRQHYVYLHPLRDWLRARTER
jgi:glycosyltransferase involved in cell wall biosynthesis